MSNALAALRRAVIARARANPTAPQTLAAFAIKLGGAALSFGFSYMIAQTFGAAGTGAYALALTTGTIAATISLIGLDYLLIRVTAGDLHTGAVAAARGAVRAVLGAVTASAILIAALLALAAVPQVQQALGIVVDNRVLGLAALAVLPLALTRIASSALRGTGRVLFAQLIDGPLASVLAVAGLGAALAAGWAGSIDAVFMLYVAANCLSVGAAWLAYARTARRWPAPERVPIAPLLRQSWRISAIVLTSLVADWLVLVMLETRFTVVETGQFRIAWQITSLIALIVVTFEAVAGPRIAAAHRVGERARIRAIYRQSVLTMSAMATPLLLATLVWPRFILGLFGTEFEVAADALRILALGQLFNILTGPTGAILIMTGRERASMAIALLSLAVLAGLGLVLIPAYGLTGAALATSLTIAFRKVGGAIVAREGMRGGA